MGHGDSNFHLLIDLADVGVLVHRNGEILLANPYMLRRLGIVSLDTLAGRDILQWIHPDDRMDARKCMLDVMENGAEFHRTPVRYLDAAGKTLDFETSCTGIQYAGTQAILTVSLDVTEQKQTKELLRKLSSATEQAGESIVITDRFGVIEYVNPAFTRITGYSEEDAIGMQAKRLSYDEQGGAANYQSMRTCILAGDVWRGEVNSRKKDGSLYPALLTVSPIVDASGRTSHFVGLEFDLSELKSLEKQFIQAQKMEAIGTLVGGIAHDFNNLLAGIMGNIHLLKEDAKALPGAVRRLEMMEQSSQRAADMIGQLLVFSRRGFATKKTIFLSSFIKETMKLLHVSVPESIVFKQQICSEDLAVHADSAQLHQILMNLVNNARDALEGVNEPCITVMLESFQTDDAFLETHAYFNAGRYAHLSVSDNGCGMSESRKQHIFEPFFTTKEIGKGTGLGLPMVVGAIKTHHGFIEVDSIPGDGSTFHVYLPLLKQSFPVAETSAPTLAQTRGKGELILFADDEEMLCEVHAEILISMGYRVVVANDGSQALDVFKKNKADISLVILDVVMPRMTGVDVAERVREMQSNVPIIFVTGYDKINVLNDSIHISNSEMLVKPVYFHELALHMRNMLDVSTSNG